MTGAIRESVPSEECLRIRESPDQKQLMLVLTPPPVLLLRIVLPVRFEVSNQYE